MPSKKGWTPLKPEAAVSGPVWNCRATGGPVGVEEWGYLGQAALRREQCDMTPESWNNGVRVVLCRCHLLDNGSVNIFLWQWVCT
jgi:hypothetical protein